MVILDAVQFGEMVLRKIKVETGRTPISRTNRLCIPFEYRVEIIDGVFTRTLLYRADSLINAVKGRKSPSGR